MSEEHDDTTTLNGVTVAGGAVMDVTDVSDDDGVLLGILRERVVLGGESRDQIAEVRLDPPLENTYGLATRGVADPQILSELVGIRLELSRIRTVLQLVFGGGRTDQ